MKVGPARGHFKLISCHPQGPARATRPANYKFTLAVTIPPNTTATVYVPAKSADAVTEGGKPTAQSPGVKFLRQESSCAVFEIESGSYQFESVSGR